MGKIMKKDDRQKIADAFREKQEIMRFLNSANFVDEPSPMAQYTPRENLKRIKQKGKQAVRRINAGYDWEYENWWEHSPVPKAPFKKLKNGNHK